MGGLKRSIKQNIEQKVSSFRHELREKGRRFCSMLLCVSMITTNLSTGAISAYAQTDSDGTNLYLYEMESEALYEALQTAISEGNTLDKDLEFYGEWAEDYEELLEADGTLYELEPEFLNEDKERDRKLGLRVFARVEGDIDLDEAYELEGTEEFVFLLANDTDEDQAAAIIVDEKVSEVITVVPGASIPVDIDAEKEAEAAADESPVEAPTEGVTGPAGGGSGGSGGAGSSAGGSTSGKKEDVEQTENVSDNAVDESGEESEEADSNSESADADSQESGEAADSESGSTSENASADSDSQTDDTTGEAGTSASDDNTGDEGNAGESSSGSETGTDESGSSEGGSSESGSTDGGSSESGSSESGSSDSGSSDSGSESSGSSSESGSSSDNGNSSSGGSADSGSGSGGGSSSSSESSSSGGNSDSGSSDSGSSDSGSSEGKTMSSISRHEVPLVAAGKATASNASAIEKFLKRASASDASPSDASYILDGTVYDAVRLKDAGAVAFITTADDLGLENDDREDLEYHFEASDGGIHAEVELEDGLDPDTIFVVERLNSGVDTSLEMAQKYLEKNLDIPADGRSYLVLDMHFTDQDGNEITVDSEADIRLSFDDPIKIIDDDIQAMHISHITNEVEDVMEEVAINNDGAVEELALHAAGFSRTVIVYNPNYEGSDLIKYTDSIFNNEDTDVLDVEITSQQPVSGTFVSGDTVSWTIAWQPLSVSRFNYDGFGTTDKTVYAELKDVSITVTLPDGMDSIGVTASGYNVTISDDGKTATIEIGDIDLDSTGGSYTVFQIDGVIAGVPAIGTTYEMTAENVTYSAVVPVIDRDTSNTVAAEYTLERDSVVATTNSMESLTSTTNDAWNVTKEKGDITKTEDGLVAEYTLKVALKGDGSWGSYAQNGRVGFGSFSLMDTPELTDADGTVYYPTEIQIELANTTDSSESVSVDGNGESPLSVETSAYATVGAADFSGAQTSEQEKLAALDANLPVYSEYKVTVTYTGDFGSFFYDEDSYTLENAAELTYVLSHVEGSTDEKIDGTDTDKVTETRSWPTKAASLDLHKYIRSIFYGSDSIDYVSGKTDLSSDYTGYADFTITDENDNEVSIYIMDDDGAYQEIENTIRIERGQMIVTLKEESASSNAVSNAVAALVKVLSGSSSGQTYTGLLYISAGTYQIQETNAITNTMTDSMVITGADSFEKADSGGYTFTVSEGSAATVRVYNKDERGAVSFTKYAIAFGGTSAEAASLPGATFTLYRDAGCQTVVATAVSDENGKVYFDRLATGITYYLKETSTPDNYLPDDTVYTVTVSANATTSSLKTTDGSTNTSISNQRNAADASFYKYLLSIATDSDADGEIVSELEQVSVDQDRIPDFAGQFRLQVSADGGSTWMEWGEFTSQSSDYDGSGSYDSFGLTREQTATADGSIEDVSDASLESLPVYVGGNTENPYYYRVVETLPEGYSAIQVSDDKYVDSSVDSTLASNEIATVSFNLLGENPSVALTNRTTGEISFKKQYVKAGTNGSQITTAGSGSDYPEVTGYLCVKNENGEYVVVSNAWKVTDDGLATIEDIDLLTSDGSEAQAYYWAEPVSTGNVTYVLENGILTDVYLNGVATEMYVCEESCYAQAYDSGSSCTMLTNILPYVRIDIRKYKILGSTPTTSYAGAAVYTVYRVDEDGNKIEVASTGTVGQSGTNIVLQTGYNYILEETKAPDGMTGLKNASGEDIDNIEINLLNVTPTTQSETSSAYQTCKMYDEPHRPVKLEKWLYDETTAVLDNDAQFMIYQSTDGVTYTLLSEDYYTANQQVSLVPGYWYAFEEVARDGILAPEIYSGSSTLTVEVFTVDGDTGTHYGFMTGQLEASESEYLMSTVNNYKNVGSIEIRKYEEGSSTAVEGVTIQIYHYGESTNLLTKALNALTSLLSLGSDANNGTTKIIDYEGTTTSEGIKVSSLPVFDDDGNKITYYIQETDTISEFFLNDTILTAELEPCVVTSVDTNEQSLIIYNERKMTVTVEVTWEDCNEKDGQQATGESDYLNILPGATVAAYVKVTSADGTVTWEYVDSAVSDEYGYATFTGLSYKNEYAFVLVSSGVDSDDPDSVTGGKYPLYASEGDEVYLTDPEEHTTLSESELENYTKVTLSSGNGTSVILNRENNGNLNNHLLYTQIHIFKYCPIVTGTSAHDEKYFATIINEDGNEQTVAAVNGATFGLYRVTLTESEMETLQNGETLDLSYEECSSRWERVSSMESGSNGTLGELDFEAVTYGEMYVYWLIEESAAAAHSMPTGQEYYRIVLYADNLGGTITSSDATEVIEYTSNETQSFDVENTHSPGGPHEYFRTYLNMNKWQMKYDEYGNLIKDSDTPLGGASFVFKLAGEADENGEYTTTIDLMDGDAAVSQSSNSSLGILNPTGINFAAVFNDWLTEIVQTVYPGVSSIADMDVFMLTEIPIDTWDAYSGMLFAAKSVNASSKDELCDLAKTYTDLEGNEKVLAQIFLEAYKDKYPTGWSVSNMENVMSVEVDPHTLGGDYGFRGYFAHIIFYESEAPANYRLNDEIYEVYLQFQSTGANGSANTKFYYYAEGLYYDSEVSAVANGTIPQDLSLDNSEKVELLNYPDPEYSVTVRKYGYELNDNTMGKTDDELDTYFTSVGSGRTAMADTTFVLQRYDSEEGEWKYYTYQSATDDSSASGSYVSVSEAQQIVTGSTGYAVVTLPIGYYRLIEVETDEAHEIILDGSTVNGATAARYFWVKKSDTGNAVNVYDPLRFNLTIEKDTLSDSGLSTTGVTFTLTRTDVDGSTPVKQDVVGGSATFTQLESGTYLVEESVSSLLLTGEYFEPFTITIGYDTAVKENSEAANEGDVYVSAINRTINDGAKGVVCLYGDEDTIEAGENYTDTVLTVHNPVTGELTVTKRDALGSAKSIITDGTATFDLYFKPFSEFVDGDDYVPDLTNVPAYTAGDIEWTYVETGTTSGGTVRFANLTPGWYAVVETAAPSGYELAAPVVSAVEADMTADHEYTANSVSVYDNYKTTLTVRKNFDLGDFFSELVDAAKNYIAYFELYVRTVDGDYISAKELGLATDLSKTVRGTYKDQSNPTVVYNSSWWYRQLVQMGLSLNETGTYTWTKTDGSTVMLDGHYYVKETQILNGNDSNANITNWWWLSKVTFTESGTTSTLEKNEDGYFRLSGFSANHTGSVTFTNTYGYAKVIIQKVGNNGKILTGADFEVYTDYEKQNKVDGVTCTDNGDGSYSILIPMQSDTETTYYIYESQAPSHYTLNETPITVDLASGEIKSYGDDETLILTDNNGVNVILTKYDNVYANRGTAEELNDVVFTLYRSEYDEETDTWGNWEPVEEGTTGSGNNGNGIVVFDTLSIDPTSYQYMIIETSLGTSDNISRFTGMESLYHGSASMEEIPLDTPVTDLEGNGSFSTGYKLDIGISDIGADYYLSAYNTPKVDVTVHKRGTEQGETAPQALIAAYAIDADLYHAGEALTDEEVVALRVASNLVTDVRTTGSTAADDGYSYSSGTLRLEEGTYLLVETRAYNSVINKDDSREVWYQVVEVSVPLNGETILVMDSPFVNVTENYSANLTKTGAEVINGGNDSLAEEFTLDHDMLEDATSLVYELGVVVDASGPINNMKLTDSGLLVTEYWKEVGTEDDSNRETVTEEVGKTYLNGHYSITSVQIPTDADYSIDNLVFTEGEGDSFAKQIVAAVTFTYLNGTKETQEVNLAIYSGQTYVTVMPNDGSAKVISFEVRWSDSGLQTATGYDLGSGFTISSDDNNVIVNMEIDQQASGNTSYYAVASFKNSADVSYRYNSWDDEGNQTPLTAEESAEAVTNVPNVEAPILGIDKTVTTDRSGNVVIGDSLTYSVKVTNSSASLGMDNPVIIDLLPQGVEINTSATSEYGLDITLSDNDSGLTITNVSRSEQDGHTILVIQLSGTLAAGGSVTLTMGTTISSSVISYIGASDTFTLTNNAFVTSAEEGTVYSNNKDGSVFRSTTGWASNDVLDNFPELSGSFNGNGYLTDSVNVTLGSTSTVRTLKEIQGDRDGDVWYSSRSESAEVTANSSSSSTDDNGYANFRLTVTNGLLISLKDLVVVDIIPKKESYDFEASRGSVWDLNFEEITSVVLNYTDGTTTTETELSNYTVWYYMDDITTADAAAAVETVAKKAQSMTETDWSDAGWTNNLNSADEGNVTAFIIVFDNEGEEAVTLTPYDSLVVNYKTTPAEMDADTLEASAGQVTWNSFAFYYTGSDGTRPSNTVKSNSVKAVLETEPVRVGGMFWIDANGNGIQDNGDVAYNETQLFTSDDYNSRTNVYRDYAAVQALLESASVTLLTYKGAIQDASDSKTFTITDSSTGRFIFTGLNTSSLSNPTLAVSLNYNDGGVIWSRLLNSSDASSYALQASIGNVGIKYSLTTPRKNSDANDTLAPVISYSPALLYGSDTYSDYWNYVLRDSNFTGSTAVSTAAKTAKSERFFLYATENSNLSEDIGLVLYRDLEITKTDSLESKVSGATFTVYGPYEVGEAEKVTGLTGETVAKSEIRTDNTGTATIEDLLYFQEYIIVENELTGYDLSQASAEGTNIEKLEGINGAWILKIPTDSDAYADGRGNDPTAYNTEDTDHVTIENSLGTNDLSFSKVEDGTDTAVSGATFKLTKNNVTVDAAWTTWLGSMSSSNLTTNEKAAMGISNVSVSSNSITFTTSFTSDITAVTLKNLPYGTYILTEEAAAPGYVKNNVVWNVTVDEDGTEITYTIGETTYSLGDADNVIRNTYAPTGELVLKAEKTEQNYTSKNEYGFAVYEATVDGETWTKGSVVCTETVTGSGTVEFDAIEYEEEGIYYYIVEETSITDKTYLTYDTTKYYITVKVKDTKEHDGNLEVAITSVLKDVTDTNGSTQKEEQLTTAVSTFTAEFINVYEASGSVDLNVTKQVTDTNGDVYKNDSRANNALTFTFDLYEGRNAVSDTWITSVDITGSELFGTEGNGTFTRLLQTITYDINDVANSPFYYTIEETVKADADGNLPAGYTANQESYVVMVTLTDKGDGTIETAYTITKNNGSSSDKILFTNVYSPSGNAELSVSKKLNGSTEGLKSGTFRVHISELNTKADSDSGEVWPYQVSGSDGTEWSSGDSGVNVWIGTDGTAMFTYDQTSTADSVAYYSKFANYTAAGSYWYLVTEVDQGGSYEYDTTEYLVRIVMSDNKDGTLQGSVEVYTYNSETDRFDSVEGNTLTFENYTTTSFTAEKQWADSSNANGTRLDSVSVQLIRTTDSSQSLSDWEKVGDAEVLKNSNSWKTEWDNLRTCDDAGNEYTYRVVEMDDNDEVTEGGSISGNYGSTYTATYEDAKDGEEVTGTEITNTLADGQLTISKEVTGSGSETESFNFTATFTLVDESTNPATSKALSGTYPMEKTSANDTESTPTSITLQAGGTYSFTLKDGESITITGLPQGTQYTVSETSVTGYQTSVNEDDGSETTGIIEAEASSEAFTNYYAEGTLTFAGNKILTGVSDDDTTVGFNYVVTKDGDEVATGSVNARGGDKNEVTFSTIHYTLEDLGTDHEATKIYVIAEKIPDEAVNGVYRGITYDQTTYEVEVKLSIDSDDEGKIVYEIISVTKLTDSKGNEVNEEVGIESGFTAEFTNAYDADGTATIEAAKYLDGAVITDETVAAEFSFTLEEWEKDGDEYKLTTNSSRGTAEYNAGSNSTSVTFSEPYTANDVGIHWYKLYENDTADTGYYDDGTVYYVIVEVTDPDNSGILQTTVTYYTGGWDTGTKVDSADVQFNNYTTTTFTVTKVWDEDNEASDRPDSIYVQLQRREGTDGEYAAFDVNGDGTIDESDCVELKKESKSSYADGWSHTWTDLEYLVPGNSATEYQYRAVEVTIDNDGTITVLESGTRIETKGGDTYYTVSYGDIDPGRDSSETITNTLGGTIQVKKTVVNEVSSVTDNNTFTVEVRLTAASGKEYAETYDYSIYTPEADGSKPEGTTTQSHEWSYEWEFELKNGQVVEIYNLPIGTGYEVLESLGTESPYTRTYSVNDEEAEDSVESVSGTISKDVSLVSVEITNTYEAEGTLTLSVEKTENYHGASIDENLRNYTFNLYEASVDGDGYYSQKEGTDVVTTTVYLANKDSIASDSNSFAEIPYSKAGTYYYIVKEEIPNGTGITYDTAVYWIEVSVDDSAHDGTLTATVRKVTKVVDDRLESVSEPGVSTYTAKFTNEYKADGTQSLKVTKEVRYGSETGKRYSNINADLEFTFELSQMIDGSETPLDTVTISASDLNGNSGKYTKEFDELLEYTAEDIGKTYTYTVKETTKPAAGFRLDSTVYTVEITISDGGNNRLTCTVVVNDTEQTQNSGVDVTFTNIYSATGSTELNVSKGLDNRHSAIMANIFAAELQEGTVSGSEFTASASNAMKASFSDAAKGADAKATFHLEYTEPGDYWYQLTEWMPNGTAGDYNDGTYTYDATIYYVHVEVVDEQDGTLKAEVAEIRKDSPNGDNVKNEGVTFENTTTTTYKVEKLWKGDNAVIEVTRPTSIFVQLRRTTDDISEGQYPYADADWKNVENVKTLIENNGIWSYDWSGSSLEKYDADGKLYTYYAFEVDADGTALTTFAGVAGNTSYTVTATGSNAQTITNTLDTGALSITKKVEGLKTSVEKYKITVNLLLNGELLEGTYNYDLNTESETYNGGKLENGSLTVELGQNETLWIKNLPLGTTYTVTEDLTDTQKDYYIASYSNAVSEGNAGTISDKAEAATVTINNIYNPHGSLQLFAEKHEEYHSSSNAEPREYNFRLYEIATAANALEEIATGSDATEIWKSAADNNLLKTIMVAINGDDVTTGRETFDIRYDGYGAEGYHYYLVDEIIPSDTNRTYDTTKYVIEVLVIDGDSSRGKAEGEGALSAVVTRFWELTYGTDGTTVTGLKEVNGDSRNYIFTNRYFAEGILELKVNKNVLYWYSEVLYGQDNRGEGVTFVFDLKAEDGITVLDTKTITADQLTGTGMADATFDTLRYDENAINKSYTYYVTEQEVTANGYLENTEMFTVVVEVEDNGDNTLTVTPTYTWSDTSEETFVDGKPLEVSYDNITFTNTYFPEGDAELIISKTLEGAELPADLFAASIRPIEIDETTGEIIYGDETTIETNTFDADGETSFTMHYDAEGDYWYEVREVIPWADIPATASNADDGTYTYDESVYYVKITVTDQHDGTLAATSVTVTETSPTGASVEVETVENGKTFRSITFENKYTDSKVDVPVTKVWKDYENRYKTRPESITVTLYRDGEKTDQTLELNDGNDWTDVFTDLDEYNYGDKIVYTVEESSIEGYAGVITGDTAEGYEITNTWTKEAPGIQIVKTASTREDGTAYKRGEVITYTIVVTNTGNVVLTDVVVTDELTGNSGDNAWTVDSLEPGESVTFTATYTVVSADVTAKNVHNEASVTAKDPEGKDVEDDDSTDTPTRSSSGSGGGGSGSGGSGSSSSASSTSSTGSSGPGVGSGLAEDEMISLLPIDYGELAKTGEGRETETWMFTSLLSGLMLILTAWLRRKKEEDE